MAAATGLLGDAKQGSIDVEGVAALDTYGAWVLVQAVREQASAGVQLRVEGLGVGQQKLMAQVGRSNGAGTVTQHEPSALATLIEQIGRAVAGIGGDLVDFANMLGAVALSLARVIVRPVWKRHLFRGRDRSWARWRRRHRVPSEPGLQHARGCRLPATPGEGSRDRPRRA